MLNSPLGSLLWRAAKSVLTNLVPGMGVVDTAKDMISEAVAQRIREEAVQKGRALLDEAHVDVIRTILWQNGLLVASLLPVYLLKSPVPFYMAYMAVMSYTLRSVFLHRGLLLQLVRTRSVTRTLSKEVQDAIELELTQRQFYERKVLEWLGPDLELISHDVARRLRPDVIAGVTNMAVTLFVAFVAFRLFAIPWLEHRALMS